MSRSFDRYGGDGAITAQGGRPRMQAQDLWPILPSSMSTRHAH